MSWKKEIKKRDENKMALEMFGKLTDENWETTLTFNDIYMLSRYLDDYAEKRLAGNKKFERPEGDDDKYMDMMGFAKEIKDLDKNLEDVLRDTRELLLDLGM